MRVSEGMLRLLGEGATAEWKNDLYGKVPAGFKEKAVFLTVKKIGLNRWYGTIEFYTDRVYDEYLKDYLDAFGPDDSEAFDILRKNGMSDAKIKALLDTVRASKTPIELDTPVKVKTTTLVRIPYGYDEESEMGVTKAMRALLSERTKFLPDGMDKDWEGGMTKTQLKFIAQMASEMEAMLQDDDELPGWVQTQITVAEENLMHAYSYMKPRA
jgi:hypothetical protein